MPSLSQSGFKVFIDPPIQIVDAVSRTLLLDFDLAKTFHPIPNNDPLNATTYSLHPVIHAANVSTSGELRGVVTTSNGQGGFTPVEHATVYALPPGETNVDNSIVCVDFTVNAGETRIFRVDNTPPPGGRALTIGFWKNWASCANSSGKQKPVLDQTLAAATPPGIKVGSFYLTTGQCTYAVNLLNKSTMTGGVKKASDPLFNMVAQLVAAELNIAAGAGTCGKVTTAIAQANALLVKYHFNGDTYSPKLTKPDALLADSLAKELDLYNNDNPNACL